MDVLRTTRFLGWAVMAPALLLVATAACEKTGELCFPADNVEARLFEVFDTDVAAHAPILVEVSNRCGDFDGLGPGVSLNVVVTGVQEGDFGHHCVPAVGAISGPPAVTPRAISTQIGPGSGYDLLHAEGDIDVDGCRGEWAFALLTGEGEGLAWTPGEFPPAVWGRYFHTANAENCPMLGAGLSGDYECVDVWAGEIESR